MRRLLMAAVLVAVMAVSAAPASAQTAPTPTPTPTLTDTAEPDGPGGCDALPFGARQACDAATGVIGGGVEQLVTGSAQAALSAVVTFVIDGAGWLLGQVAEVIDSTTRPEVTSGWLRASYRDMTAIAVLGLLPFLLLAIIQGLVRQEPGLLLRSTFGLVPLAAIGTAAAVVVVDMLVAITDQLSAWVGRSIGTDLSAFATGVGDALSQFGLAASGVSGFAALLGAGVVAFATFVIWLELLLRQAAIYVAVLFLPLGFMAMVWPATAHLLRRLVQGLVAIVLSKFVIVAVMALASTALDAQVAAEGYGTVLAGAALLSMAALSPYVLLRLIPVFEAGIATNLEGTLRRPTAAVGNPVHVGGAAGMTRLLRQQLAGGWSTSMAGGGVGASSAGATVGGVATAGGLAAVQVTGAAASGAKDKASETATKTAETVRIARHDGTDTGSSTSPPQRAGGGSERPPPPTDRSRPPTRPTTDRDEPKGER